MARTLVTHLQVKIWQEPLLATVCHCLLKRDAKDRLFGMPRYSSSFRDGLVGFSRNPRLIRVLTYPTTFACRFPRLQLTRFVSFNVRPLLAASRRCNSHVLFPLTLTLFQQQPAQSENRRTKIDARQTTTGYAVTCAVKQVEQNKSG